MWILGWKKTKSLWVEMIKRSTCKELPSVPIPYSLNEERSLISLCKDSCWWCSKNKATLEIPPLHRRRTIKTNQLIQQKHTVSFSIPLLHWYKLLYLKKKITPANTLLFMMELYAVPRKSGLLIFWMVSYPASASPVQKLQLQMNVLHFMWHI